MAATQWTPQMVEQIRNGFLNGLELKVMAIAVGRTPGAVNKALSRFGIRRTQNLIAFRGKSKRLPNIPKEKSINGTDQWFRKFLNREREKWVNFDEIISYLNSQNLKVLPGNAKLSPLKNRQFIVGTKQYNALQILLIANKLRAEQNLSTFFVNNLSW